MSTLIELVRSVFEPDGHLSKVIENYHFNADQADYVYRIAQTLQSGENNTNTVISLLEADTGIGKSIGYLVPMMLHSALTGERVAISTFTLQLQNQLLKKDIETVSNIVEAITGTRLKAAPRKGMRNFVSRSKVDALVADHYDNASQDERKSFDSLLAWSLETATGDIREYLENYGELPMGLQSIDICLDTDSPEEDAALYRQHAEKAKDADIVVVTHIMLLMHSMYGFTLLNKEDGRPISHVVADEADRIPSAAESLARKKLSPHMLVSFLRAIKKKTPEDHHPKIDRLIAEAENLSFYLKSIEKEGHSHQIILRETSELIEPLTQMIKKIQTRLTALDETELGITGHDLIKLDAFRRDALHVQSVLRNVSRINNKTEQDDNKDINAYQSMLVLSWSPVFNLPAVETILLNPGRIASRYWQKNQQRPFGYLKSCVLTSASMTIPGQRDETRFFDFMNDVGLYEKHHVIEHKVSYEHEAFGDADFVFASPDLTGPIYVEDDEESVTETTVVYDEDWLDNTAKMITAAHRQGGDGRTLVLVNSFNDVEMLVKNLSDRIDESMLIPHYKGNSLAGLLYSFKAQKGSILITPTGWEGLDLPGLLSNVVIARIPFSPPDTHYNAILKRYLIEIRQCAESKANQLLFMRNINNTRRKLKQGLGRGIRQNSDSVTFWFCDPRFPMPDELKDKHFNNLRFSFKRRQYNNLFVVIPRRFRDGLFAKVLYGKVFDGEILI